MAHEEFHFIDSKVATIQPVNASLRVAQPAALAFALINKSFAAAEGRKRETGVDFALVFKCL